MCLFQPRREETEGTVEELEKMRGRLSYNEDGESSQDSVQGVAPRLGEGLGKSGLDGYNLEDIWQL